MKQMYFSRSISPRNVIDHNLLSKFQNQGNWKISMMSSDVAALTTSEIPVRVHAIFISAVQFSQKTNQLQFFFWEGGFRILKTYGGRKTFPDIQTVTPVYYHS